MPEINNKITTREYYALRHPSKSFTDVRTYVDTDYIRKTIETVEHAEIARKQINDQAPDSRHFEYWEKHARECILVKVKVIEEIIG